MLTKEQANAIADSLLANAVRVRPARTRASRAPPAPVRLPPEPLTLRNAGGAHLDPRLGWELPQRGPSRTLNSWGWRCAYVAYPLLVTVGWAYLARGWISPRSALAFIAAIVIPIYARVIFVQRELARLERARLAARATSAPAGYVVSAGSNSRRYSRIA